jgi:hypothetical protein
MTVAVTSRIRCLHYGDIARCDGAWSWSPVVGVGCVPAAGPGVFEVLALGGVPAPRAVGAEFARPVAGGKVSRWQVAR